MTRLERELAAIPDMAPSELRLQWDQMGLGAAPRVPPSVLRQLLAQHLQERRYGSLSALVKRELPSACEPHLSWDDRP